MSSVNGLVHVKVVRGTGVVAPPAAKLYVRVRLLPWKEEGFTGSVHAAEGEAVWDDEVVLAHLSTASREAPSLVLELKSRELYVYERTLGRAEIDMHNLITGQRCVEKWLDLRGGNQQRQENEIITQEFDGPMPEENEDAQEETIRLLVRIQFTRGPHHVDAPSLQPESAQHLFRLASYARPTWCAVCGRLLVGIRHQGFKCEACGLDCHRDCQLKAHASFECDRSNVRRGDDDDVQLHYDDEVDDVLKAEDAVDPNDESEEVPEVVADSSPILPPRRSSSGDKRHTKQQPRTSSTDRQPRTSSTDSTPQKFFAAEDEHPDDDDPTNDTTTTTTGTTPKKEGEQQTGGDEHHPVETGEAIGAVTLKLRSCTLLDASKVGDHYLRVHVRPSRDVKTATMTQRTHTVYQSSRPRFDATWYLPIETFASEVRVELVDAARDVVVGTLQFGIHDLRQEQADLLADRIGDAADDVAKKFLSFVVAPSAAPKTKKKVDETTARAYFLDGENAYFRDRHGTPAASAEVEKCEVKFYETDLFWSATPRDAGCEPPPDNFSLEVARRHVERARQVIQSVYDFFDAYEDIMKWTDPLATGPLFVAYVGCCLWLNAEYAGVLPFVWLSCLLIFALRRRLRGDPRLRFFSSAAETLADQSDLSRKTHRPLARLRVAVCAGTGLDGLPSSASGAPDVYVAASFVHGPPTKVVDPPVVVPAAKEEQTTTAKEPVAAAPKRRGPRRRRRRRSDSGDITRRHRKHSEDALSEDDLLLDLLEEEDYDDLDDDLDDENEEEDDGQEEAPQEEDGRESTASSKRPSLVADFDPQQHPQGLLSVSPTGEKKRLSEDVSGKTPPPPRRQPSKDTPDEKKKPPQEKHQEKHVVEHVLGYTGTCRGSFEPRWHGALGVSVEPRSKRRVDASGVISRLVGSVATLGGTDHPSFGGPGASYAVVESWERRGFGETDDSEPLVDRALVYPVLQPVDDDDKGDKLVSWARAGGELRFRVLRQHPLDRLLDSEIGRVTVPLASLVDDAALAEKKFRGWGAQKERRGWYDVVVSETNVPDGSDDKKKKDAPKDDHNEEPLQVDTSSCIGTTTPSVTTLKNGEAPHLPSLGGGAQQQKKAPALNLRLQLVLNEASRPSTFDQETSRAVEAMSRPLTEDDETSLNRLLGTKNSMNNPLSTVVSVHENATYAQNCLGYVLDFLESWKNMLSWTHPEKTGFVLLCSLVGVLLFAKIQTRWLLLAGGLYEFTYRLIPFYSGSPMTTRLFNLLRSLPNDADLKRCYHHRAFSYAQTVVRQERRRRRRAKLHAIWAPRWEGFAHFRDDSHPHPPGSSNSGEKPVLRHRRHDDDREPATAATTDDQELWGEPRYLVLHGRRLLWWHSERDLDVGRSPGGQLLLQGHSGLTDPSPTDLAAASTTSTHLLLAIFGQTTDGAPLRWTVMLPSTDDKTNLAAAVLAAVRSRLK